MTTQLTRRRFLQITAATFGAASAPLAIEAAVTPSAGGGDREVPTFCEMCFWRCGGIAHVRDGRVVKFVGNPRDIVSRGRLCPRGTGAVGAVYDPDRLKKPLLRKGPRGEERFEPVGWDEALDFIAGKMRKLKEEHGPEALAMFNHGIGQRMLQHLLKSWGAINFGAPSFAQCRGPRDVGFLLTMGAEVGSPEPTDMLDTECLTLIGTHLGENMHNTQVQDFAEAVARRIPLIVVDPRFSVAASKATHWLPIRPGTDLALVRAWMNVIVTEGLYDRDFVAKHGHGFDRFAADLASSTPEWAAPETGLDPSLIRTTARLMARHRPASLVHPGRRYNWNGDDTQRGRAVALLNALLGNWGRKGGIYFSNGFKVAGYPMPPYPESDKAPADAGRFPFATETTCNGIRDATLSGQPYPIKGWLVYSTDLMHALPNQEETRRAIDQLDLLVVIDTVPCDLAGYADVVLPESTFLERHDELLTGWGRQGWVSLRQPVVPSPDDQKPGWWIAKQLAARLGIEACMPFKDMEDYLRGRIEKTGLSWDKLVAEGVMVGPKKPITLDDGAEFPELETPTGKVEFWSAQLKDKGFDPVPRYTPPPQVPEGFFPLITGRSPVHTFSRTQSNPLLTALMDENEVWVHGETAARLGLRNGQYVRLKNEDGVQSNRVKVKATQRIRPDTLYLVYGFGHTNRMRPHAFQKGASAAQLNTRYKVDPLMGGTSLHANYVTIVKEA